MPTALAALVGVFCCAGLYRWWPASPTEVRIETPQRLVLTVAGRERTVEAPFRVLLRPCWLALYCPGQGWVWLLPDQVSTQQVTPLRQVLWLQRA